MTGPKTGDVDETPRKASYFFEAEVTVEVIEKELDLEGLGQWRQNTH